MGKSGNVEILVQVETHVGPAAEWHGDALAVGIIEGGEPQPAAEHLGKGVKQLIKGLVAAQTVKGKVGETLLLPTPAGADIKAERLLLVGMGKLDKITAEVLRSLGATMVRACDKARVKSLGCLLSADRLGQVGRAQAAGALAEGAMLGQYHFDAYRSGKEAKEEGRKSLERLAVMVQAKKEKQVQEKFARTVAIVRGVYLTRDLGNHPSNVVTPEKLAQVARDLGDRLPIKVTVLDEKDLEKKGMHGILGVGQGSAHPPRLIVLEYREGGDKAPLAVVGKAVTFDSGGISIKPSANMEEMKFDMSGGGAVFGFLQAVAEMKLPVNVVGVVPAAENMPSGTAQRPGDIIKTAKGVFVEVINTDAEGRLILADALHHAESFHPDAIIDLATLTGACVIALGSHACGLMGNDKKLIKQVRKAGNHVGERAWPLPMFPEYQEAIKSSYADIKNVGNREAGTITGACFLSRFVDKDRAWVHLDIAGTADDSEGKRPHMPKGATGFGVRLLCGVLRKRMK